MNLYTYMPLCKVSLVSLIFNILLTPFLVTLPNSPSYFLAPCEVMETECQIQQILNLGHIQPSSSPCSFHALIIPEKETNEWHLVMSYHTPQ